MFEDLTRKNNIYPNKSDEFHSEANAYYFKYRSIMTSQDAYEYLLNAMSKPREDEHVPLPTDAVGLAKRIASSRMCSYEQAQTLSAKALAGQKLTPGERCAVMRANVICSFPQLLNSRSWEFIQEARRLSRAKFLMTELIKYVSHPHTKEETLNRLRQCTSYNIHPLTRTDKVSSIVDKIQLILEFYYALNLTLSIFDSNREIKVDWGKVTAFEEHNRASLHRVFGSDVPRRPFDLAMWFGLQLEKIFDINSVFLEGGVDKKSMHVCLVSPWAVIIHDQRPLILHYPLEIEEDVYGLQAKNDQIFKQLATK